MLSGMADTTRAQVRPEVGLSFAVGLPQGEFSEKLDQNGFGGSLYGGIGFDRLPVFIGASLDFLIYGYERRTEPFSNTIPDVRVNVATSNNIAAGHLLFRLQPPIGAVRPYLDGLIGFKYLFTQTSIDSEGWMDDGEPIAASTNFDDIAFSYGAGGGLHIPLYSGKMGDANRIGSVMLNIGARYLFGSEAEYLKEGSIRRTNGSVSFDVERSRTAVLEPQFGVVFRF